MLEHFRGVGYLDGLFSKEGDPIHGVVYAKGEEVLVDWECYNDKLS
jgi:hypothetical protein